MIALIIYEAVWLFTIWWDHKKPLGVLFAVVMMLIPFIFIARNISKYGNSGLSEADAALLGGSDEESTSYREPFFDSDHDNTTKTKTHAEWVSENNAKERKRGEEYDRMWAEEYMDEHDY